MQVAQSELKTMVAEAVRSLAKLDADRLEELALSCQALNCDLTSSTRRVHEAHEATRDMAALAQLLKATSANATVMKRLRELHTRRMEYSVAQVSQVNEREILHGLH